MSQTTEKKEKAKSPYFRAHWMFKEELLLLKELNKQLPKSIKQIIDKRTRGIRGKVTKLDRKSKVELNKITESFVKYYEELCKEKKPSPKLLFVPTRRKTYELFREAFNTLLFSLGFNTFIRDMSLVYLIAEFEGFLRQVLEISFERRPEILASSQKSVTLEELMKFKDINDAKQQVIQKEILSIINQDIEDINTYFEQKFNTELCQFTNWRKFKERFYRRNILIHNSGWTNRLYRLKTGYRGKDKRMTVSQNYLKESIELFEDMGSKISEHFYEKFK